VPQLEALPGIGPKTAEAILRYREEKGGFRRLEELMEVKGIGAKRFETLKGFLRVGP
jgi:competence protein ComEA